MKQFNKHTISILLMCSSIALLLVFQFFWLRKVYEEQRVWLQKEADLVFRNTIMELQDALFEKNMRSSVVERGDSINVKWFPEKERNMQADTVIYVTDAQTRILIPARSGMPLEKSRSNSESFSSTFNFTLKSSDSTKALSSKHSNRFLRMGTAFPVEPDSIRSIHVNKMLQKVIMNVEGTDGREIVIQVNNDSLTLDSLQLAFTKNLHQAGMPVPFLLQKVKFPEWEKPDDQIKLGPVPAGMPMRDFFTAEIENYDAYLFQKIVPQFLFSLFLTLITTLAFLLIYRNLRQQERLTALKNDFISNVTHELKTPIATVSVAIEALSNFNALQNPQLTKEYLDISKNELNRLTILVDKVLKMSIFEQKEPELQLESINVKELVQQITASMRLQFEKYHAEVNVDATGEDFMIQGDRLHLTSVVYNLVDNALKYSPEDPKIDITLEQQNGHLHVMVQDNGIGIAPEYKNRVFEKFFRVPTGDVHNVKGYGLGLNYVASVVQKHGGKIDVESAPGKGSCFTVALPRYFNH